VARPWWVDYTEDRDLWRLNLPHSLEVNAFLMALPHTIEAWDQATVLGPGEAVTRGAAIRLHIDHYVEKVAKEARFGIFHDRRIAYVNAAYPNTSDVAQALLEKSGVEISMVYATRADGKMQFGMRSKGEISVAEIAKQYGGGGHKNAAGFQVAEFDGVSRILAGISSRNGSGV
jgi:hypothetical protein